MKHDKILGCIFLIVFMITVQINIQAQGAEFKSPPSISTSSIPDLENSILWEISGKGLNQPSYLFGTMHVICAEDYFWTEVMDSTFHASSLLVLEVDLAEYFNLYSSHTSILKEDTETTLYEDSINKVAYYADIELDTSYTATTESSWLKHPNEYLSKIDFPKYEVEIDVDSILEELLETEKTIYLPSLNCREQESYEFNLVDLALASDKKMEGLETFIEQMTLIMESSDSSYEDTTPSNGDSLLQIISSYYKEQRLNEMYIFAMPFMGSPKQAYALIDQRNINWMQKIPAMIQVQTCFIAVGAAHLSGHNGLIQLLRNHGYTLTPIFNTK